MTTTNAILIATARWNESRAARAKDNRERMRLLKNAEDCLWRMKPETYQQAQ
jgi:hypothetical protein